MMMMGQRFHDKRFPPSLVIVEKGSGYDLIILNIVNIIAKSNKKVEFDIFTRRDYNFLCALHQLSQNRKKCLFLLGRHTQVRMTCSQSTKCLLCNLLANISVRQANTGQCRPVVLGPSVDDVTFQILTPRSFFETPEFHQI